MQYTDSGGIYGVIKHIINMNRYRSEIIVCLSLIIAILAVYWQVIDHDFVNYDDDQYVTENHHVQAGLTKEGVKWAFTTRLHGHWHPLTWLSHMTDCQLFGLNPGPHHITSLFFHIANTLLLFLVFKWMTGALMRSAFIAALFALHPLHVETVAWVADRKDVLSAFFWMLTMLAYVNYSKRPGAIRYLLILVVFVLGIMAKPMVVTLPIVFILMDYWPLNRFRFGETNELHNRQNHKLSDSSHRHKHTSSLRLFWEKISLFVFVGASVFITVLVMGRETNITISKLCPTGCNIANAVVSYTGYIGKTLWPLNLAIPYPRSEMPAIWELGGAGLLLLCISFLVFWGRKRCRYLVVGWLWYLITLVPVVGVIRSGPHTMADRYTYVPIMGLFIMIAWGVPDLVRAWRYRRIALAISTGLLLFGLMVCAWFQAGYWKDSIRLFTHTLNVTTNNYDAHNNLGLALAKRGEIGKSIAHYNEALRIDPDMAEANNNLGLALVKHGRIEDAVVHYNKALRYYELKQMGSKLAETHNNMGLVLVKQGKIDEAISHYQKALKIEPNLAEIHNNLGLVSAEQGRIEEAINHYSRALSIKPDYAEAHNNLGLAFIKQGKSEEALNHYSRAISIKPEYAEAYNNLGLTLSRQGKANKAIVHYKEALRIEPNLPIAHNNLGYALAEQGKIEEAMSHYNEALRIKPDYAEAHNNMGIALARQGRLEDAVDHFQEALRIKPNLAEAGRNLDIALRLMGKH